VKGVLPIALLFGGVAYAYTVQTGFSDACHEQITLEAYSTFLVDLPASVIPEPPGDIGAQLAQSIRRQFNLTTLDDRQQALFLNLVIGVRAPDTEGHSLLELDNTRLIHVSRDNQYPHALRGPGDDGPEGDRAAVAATRQEIVKQVQLAIAALSKPSAEQFLEAKIYVEFYGFVTVKAWAPAFYIGRALHALQDSFSHTLRSPDFRRIRHVLNYADALGGGFDEARDGLRHSGAMDECGRSTSPIVRAAVEATVDVLLGAVTSEVRLNESLDRWLSYEAGCSVENDYCNSDWLFVARRSPTRPALGCTSTDGSPLILCLAILFRGLGGRRTAWLEGSS
jgi:hypothetical protein